MSTRRSSAAILTAILLAGAVEGWAPDPAAAAAPRVDCASCLIVTEDGTTLWARAARVRRPIASATKMVTALVVVETADLDATVEVSARAAAVPGGRFSLQAGDVFTVRDLLFALLLGSSNDAAVALAEHVAGSEEAFVARMNEAARELGARRTTFTTPHGLDAAGHLSTAADLALIGATVLKDPFLAEVVSTARASLAGPRGPETVENTNELLESYDGLLGIKTGFTADAGNVLVAAAERQGRRLITVAMDSQNAFQDSRRLLNFGFRMLSTEVLVAAGDEVGSVVFDPAGAMRVAAGGPIRGLALRENVRMELRVAPDLRPPIARGERVGSVVIKMGEEVIGRTTAVAATPVTSGAPGWPERSLSFLIRLGARALPGGGG